MDAHQGLGEYSDASNDLLLRQSMSGSEAANTAAKARQGTLRVMAAMSL